MNIALIGYGRMGKEIERLCAQNNNVSIVKIFTEENNPRSAGLTEESLRGVDVCLDFSTPESVVGNIKAAASCKKNIVVGTTGWLNELPDVRRMIERHRTGLLYSSNFSLGMNLFYKIVASAAQLIDRYDVYDSAIQESHHRGKADSPSGTAMSIAEILMAKLRGKDEVITTLSNGAVKPNQLQIASTRAGSIAGTHRVIFDSSSDSIELIHAAKDRSGFALGAVTAAEWLNGKSGIFTMNDVIG